MNYFIGLSEKNQYLHFFRKAVRIKKDQKVFGMYTSMFVGETEKIKSVPYKYMIIFLLLLLGAGLVFKFGFMNILTKMNSKHVKKEETIKIPETIPVKTKVIQKTSHNNLFKIIGIVDDHYIVKTHKGLKKVKISSTDKKNINDEIRIEKL